MTEQTATNVGWHPADPPLYVGKHRDDSAAAWSRQCRAASHSLVYGQHYQPRHDEATR